ncbi:hypothetical protein EDF38_1328 [Frigoribacterium sp. PhB160]|uniref:hypothetical protein n=1 Tax=Frigoribacterium sp. PhB160 TaxID=2485192 RepID=UPI000F4A6540|nr:hypothetical protein [Frigoribacterium sp. PhB160]ROS62224.1 hypothetical protein EDF38_1328 [Frigoribacterium sp. PhB160]
MFTRRAREADQGDDSDDRSTGPARMGVGAQVYVLDSDEDAHTPFPYGPTGVVLRAGGSAWQGVSAIGGSARTWWVEFDSPQIDRDGDGPVERAQVAERWLRLAPPLG